MKRCVLLRYHKHFSARKLACDIAIACRKFGLNDSDFVKLSKIHTRALTQIRNEETLTFETTKKIMEALKKLESGAVRVRRQ